MPKEREREMARIAAEVEHSLRPAGVTAIEAGNQMQLMRSEPALLVITSDTSAYNFQFQQSRGSSRVWSWYSLAFWKIQWKTNNMS